MTQTIKYAITLAVLVLLGVLLYYWHNGQINKATFETRRILEVNEESIRQLSLELIESNSKVKELIRYKDSTLAAINTKDTIVIYKKYEGKINSVRNLGTDSAISLLTRNLSRKNPTTW